MYTQRINIMLTYSENSAGALDIIRIKDDERAEVLAMPCPSLVHHLLYQSHTHRRSPSALEQLVQ